MATLPTGAAADHFRATAPKYMRLFMRDFDASDLDAAAVFGNAGYESLGFTALQEIKPVVKGSKGGFGWFQWTGPRRRAFEAYCERNKLTPSSDDANYKFLFVELTGTESGSMAKLKAAKTLDGKTEAFEKAFERAGVKAYEKRKQWAALALDALRKAAEPQEPPPATPTPAEPPLPPTGDPDAQGEGFQISWRKVGLIAAIVLTGVWVFFNFIA